MKTLEEKIGYTFRDRTLLENALTHSSYANEHRGGLPSNERLEFLGDSILGLVVADHLYRTRPDLPEGDLTRIRAALVCEGSLVQVAKSLDLGSYLKLGKGEAHGGGRARPSIQADAVEAMLAAVYLDGGIGQARKLIHDLVLTDTAFNDRILLSEPIGGKINAEQLCPDKYGTAARRFKKLCAVCTEEKEYHI